MKADVAILVCIYKVLVKPPKIVESQTEFIPVASLTQFEEAFDFTAALSKGNVQRKPSISLSKVLTSLNHWTYSFHFLCLHNTLHKEIELQDQGGVCTNMAARETICLGSTIPLLL